MNKLRGRGEGNCSKRRRSSNLSTNSIDISALCLNIVAATKGLSTVKGLGEDLNSSKVCDNPNRVRSNDTKNIDAFDINLNDNNLLDDYTLNVSNKENSSHYCNPCSNNTEMNFSETDEKYLGNGDCVPNEVLSRKASRVQEIVNSNEELIENHMDPYSETIPNFKKQEVKEEENESLI